MASDLLMNISQDERERAIFRSRRKFQMDQDSNIATAEARGKEIGEEIGEARGKAIGEAIGEAKILKIVKLLAQEKTDGEISRELEIPVTEVERVKQLLAES